MIHSTGEISAAPVEKVAKPNLSTEEIPEELPTKSVAIIGPQEKATPPVVVEETVPEATPLVEPVTILNENIPKETLPVKDDLVTLEDEDSVVYAEDTGYKAYNLSLQPLENGKLKRNRFSKILFNLRKKYLGFVECFQRYNSRVKSR